jgi:hypothetical protein
MPAALSELARIRSHRPEIRSHQSTCSPGAGAPYPIQALDEDGLAAPPLHWFPCAAQRALGRAIDCNSSSMGSVYCAGLRPAAGTGLARVVEASSGPGREADSRGPCPEVH